MSQAHDVLTSVPNRPPGLRARGEERVAHTVPTLLGMHHVRVPVSDVLASQDWYARTVGLVPVLVTEDEDRVTGSVMRHPSGVVLGVHLAPLQARALEGFAVLGLAIADVGRWVAYLDGRDIGHGELMDAHLGLCLHLRDPDGLVVELHTDDQPSAESA